MVKQALQIYEDFWFRTQNNRFNEEASVCLKFQEFVKKDPTCFDRNNLERHVTGSALLLSKDHSKVLLTHHAKLHLWLQLGGHSDGDPLTHQVAEREAKEESGMLNLQLWDWGKKFNLPAPAIMDLDIHLIPAHQMEPAHWHYDARYLFEVTGTDMPIVSSESHDLKWFDLQEVDAITSEASLLRLFAKCRWLIRE